MKTTDRNLLRNLWLGIIAALGWISASWEPAPAANMDLTPGCAPGEVLAVPGGIGRGGVGGCFLDTHGFVWIGDPFEYFCDRVDVCWQFRRDCDGAWFNVLTPGHYYVWSSQAEEFETDCYDVPPTDIKWTLGQGTAWQVGEYGCDKLPEKWTSGSYTALFRAFTSNQNDDGTWDVKFTSDPCQFQFYVHTQPPSIQLSSPGQKEAYQHFPHFTGLATLGQEFDACGAPFGCAPYLPGHGLVGISYRLQRKSDGKYFGYNTSGVPLWGSDSRFLGFDAGHALDVAHPSFDSLLDRTGLDTEDTFFLELKVGDELALTTTLPVRAFQVDRTPPDSPTITFPIQGSTTPALPAIQGSAFDNPGGSGASSVSFWLARLSDDKLWNGSAWTPVSPLVLPLLADVNAHPGGIAVVAPSENWLYNESLPAGADLLDGDYQIEAWTSDNAGNNSPRILRVFHIDKSAPGIAFTSPQDQAGFTNGMPAFRGTVTPTAGQLVAGVDLVLLQVWFDPNPGQGGQPIGWQSLSWSGARWDSSPVTNQLPCALNGNLWSYVGATPTGTDLAQSRYVVAAIARDNAGHSSWANRTFFIDTNAPMGMALNITNGASLNGLNHLSGIIKQPTNTSPVNVVVCLLRRRRMTADRGLVTEYWNGTQWQSASTTFLASVVQDSFTGEGVLPSGANLLDGSYSLSVAAINAAGLTNAPAQTDFTVDLTPPVSAIITPTNRAQLLVIPGLSGTAYDTPGGSGVGQVAATLMRVSDGAYWASFAVQWSAQPMLLPVSLVDTNWSVDGVWLPSDQNLAPGDYLISAVAYDAAGNDNSASNVTARVTVPDKNPVAINLGLIPSTVFVGDPSFEAMVLGADYGPESWMYCNGVIRPAVCLDSTRMAFAVDASELIAPTTLRIGAWNPAPGGGGSNTLWLQVLARPAVPNDNFVNRLPLGGAVAQTTGSNAGASYEPGEPPIVPDFWGGRSVWWSWTAPADGPATVSTLGSSFDTLLGVFTGNVISNLTPVTSAEGLSGVDVNFTAQKGVQYQIAVDGNWPAFGNINLAVNQNGAPGALFQDSFSTSQGSWDVNYEAGLGRQAGGRLGVLYYVESANTSAGGPNDALTQVNSPQAPLQLLLNPTNNTWVSVSPGANFTQSGALQIEFDLNPGINDPGHTSSDWAGVVFGATGQNVYINQSDGMGILFRNNLQMQVFSGSNMIYQGDGGFVGGLPSGPFHVQINLKCADFQGSAATVALLINGVPAKIGPGGAALYTKSDGFQANYLTLLGYADWNQGWLDGFGNLKVGVPAPVAAVLGARLDASGNLVLTWATPLAGFNLQRADTLGGPWSAVTAPVTIQNGQNTVTLPATGQSRFFRLSKATGSPATFTDSHPPADRQVFYRTVSP